MAENHVRLLPFFERNEIIFKKDVILKKVWLKINVSDYSKKS